MPQTTRPSALSMLMDYAAESFDLGDFSSVCFRPIGEDDVDMILEHPEGFNIQISFARDELLLGRILRDDWFAIKVKKAFKRAAKRFEFSINTQKQGLTT